MSRLPGLSVAAAALAAVAFWTALVGAPPRTEAGVEPAFDINEALSTVSRDAPIQDAGAIACTYVLTDGHRCH